MCNATTTRITVIVGHVEIFFVYDNRNDVYNKDGFNISVLDANLDVTFLVQFVVQIQFTALTENVTVTCKTPSNKATRNVVFDSELSYIVFAN